MRRVETDPEAMRRPRDQGFAEPFADHESACADTSNLGFREGFLARSS